MHRNWRIRPHGEEHVAPKRSSSVARWGLVLSLLSLVGLGLNIYYTHFYRPENLDVSVAEYRLTDNRDPGDRVAPFIDIALVNTGAVPARYMGSTLYAHFPPDNTAAYPLEPVTGDRFLVEPHEIRGVELYFPAIRADKVRQAFADAGLDTEEVRVPLTLEVKAMDSRGHMLSQQLHLSEIVYMTGGTVWSRAEEDSLTRSIIPGGTPSLKIRGSAVFWKPVGISFVGPDAPRYHFYSDSTGFSKRQ